MARYRFDDTAEDESTSGLVSRGSDAAILIVRAFGFVLMLIGFFIAVRIMLEAWGLYVDPNGIEPFARAIEQGSGLDRTIAASVSGDPAAAPEQAASPEGANLRLSYFIAWFVAILLLMLVGRLAIAAMRAGGELVLYDVPLKRFIRELNRASGRG